jgi:steroid delta-isomerase-like uncharacterized protein
MRDYEECKRLVRTFYDGVNNNDRETLNRILDENYVFHNFKDTYNGREAAYTFLDEIRTSFPDMHIVVNEQVADDTYVVSRLRMTGTHDGEFAGVPATHKKVEATGMVMFKFDGDKVVEQWAEWDIVNMLGQVGAKPMRPQDC